MIKLYVVDIDKG